MTSIKNTVSNKILKGNWNLAESENDKLNKNEKDLDAIVYKPNWAGMSLSGSGWRPFQ